MLFAYNTLKYSTLRELLWLEHLLHYSREHGLSLLKASSEDGARYARDLERTFKPSSVGVRLAGGRLLYGP